MRRYTLNLSKFLKVGKEFKVLKIPMFLPKVNLFVMWKEVFRFWRCIIRRLERC